MALTETIDLTLKIATLIGGIIVVLYALSFIFKKKIKLDFVKQRVLLFGFVITLAATLGSLFYSEIRGYTPCELCWYQRVFMYSQLFLFAIAYFKKDKKIFLYTVPLSVIGLLIAGYHYLLQIGLITSSLSCATIGNSANCSEAFFLSFGYISIPMMALTAFALLIILSHISGIYKRKE